MAEIQVEEGFDMDRILKIFLVCAAGGGIGTAFANHFHQHWWLGLLIGALIGYLGFELEKIPSAMRAAWHATVDYQIDWVGLRAYCSCLAVYLGLISSATIIFSAISIPIYVMTGKATWEFAIVYNCLAMYFELGVMALIVSLILAIFYVFDRTLPALDRKNEAENWQLALQLCPILFIPTLMVKAMILIGRIPSVIVGACILVCKALRAIAKMTCLAFRLIHSDLRLLCAVDACFGTWIGHLAGNVAIGAMIGGLSGVANYYFISVLWLKLVPVREPVEL